MSTASKRGKESHANELSRALGKYGVHHDAGEGCSSKRQKAVLQLPYQAAVKLVAWRYEMLPEPVILHQMKTVRMVGYNPNPRLRREAGSRVAR